MDNPESGFTLPIVMRPLDLRMDKTKNITAADIINTFTEEDLANVFYQYGEEKNSRKISRIIVERRSLKKLKLQVS
ncbi:MAG: 16S rRNA (cytosine(1402)-N(4))-methyltransferase [Ignavibacteriales bacterium]|nr:16S rRNA (cytosine(1402)-N(4))-methyltransferase [Ignavibacteriales bacterium]